MALEPADIDAMLASDCSAEQIGAVVKAALAREEAKRAEAREKAKRRKAEQRKRDADAREMSRNVTVTTRDSQGQPSPPTPDKERTKEINPTPTPVGIPSARTREAEFNIVWAAYPHKVGKRDALKAFHAARHRASFDAILAGVERYAAKTDDRPWCNPSTFFNQDRWEDQPAEPPAPTARGSPAAVNGKRTALDAIAARQAARNGQPSGTGNRGDVELLPSGFGSAGHADGELRGGIGGRYLRRNH